MRYECPSCGFVWIENMGGTLEEAFNFWSLSKENYRYGVKIKEY